MTVRWFIKRKPLGRSFFRDGFPYFSHFHGAGSMWVEKRSQAPAFITRADARVVWRKLRKADRAICIVRVTRRCSTHPKPQRSAKGE